MKYKFQTSLLLAVLFLSACNKEFLETKPTDQVDAGTAILTVENAKASLNGIHRAMFNSYGSQGSFGQGTNMLNSDVLGDDYVFSGQSNGWFSKRNSSTPSRAFFTNGVFVNIFIPPITGIAHETTGLGDFSISTKHILQLPAIDNFS